MSMVVEYKSEEFHSQKQYSIDLLKYLTSVGAVRHKTVQYHFNPLASLHEFLPMTGIQQYTLSICYWQ